MTSRSFVIFGCSTPLTKAIVHEFGHILGFHEENGTVNPCTVRTSGGTSLEGESDLTLSVMSQLNCNGTWVLSAWDILGARRLYGMKTPGTIAGHSGLALNIQGASTAIGTPIIGWPASLGWHNSWKRPSTSSFLLRAMTDSHQRCLNVEGGAVGSGFTPLVSWECDGAENEQFHFTGVQWRAMGNRCVRAESAASGSRLSIAPCSATSALHKWDFFEGSRRIRLNGTNLCAGVPGGSTALGTELQLATCSGFASQAFTYANGHILFNSSRCLHVLGGTTATGSRIGLWDGCMSVPPMHSAQFTTRGPVTAMGQCVEMSGTVPFDGIPIGVAPCVSNVARQTWEYTW